MNVLSRSADKGCIFSQLTPKVQTILYIINIIWFIGNIYIELIAELIVEKHPTIWETIFLLLPSFNSADQYQMKLFESSRRKTNEPQKFHFSTSSDVIFHARSIVSRGETIFFFWNLHPAETFVPYAFIVSISSVLWTAREPRFASLSRANSEVSFHGFVLPSSLIPFPGIGPGVSLSYFPSKLVFLPDRSHYFYRWVRRTNVCSPSFVPLFPSSPWKLAAIMKILTDSYRGQFQQLHRTDFIRTISLLWKLRDRSFFQVKKNVFTQRFVFIFFLMRTL